MQSVSFQRKHITATNALQLEAYDDNIMEEDSTASSKNKLLKLNRYEFRKVSLLGEGCFSNVYLILSESRTRKEKLALKCLDPKKINSAGEFLTAAVDLVTEAKILHSLDHENIIKLRGVCSTRFSESFDEGSGGYFILTNVMHETLKERIRRWRMDPACFEKQRGRGLRRYIRRPFKTAKVDRKNMYGRIETTALGIAEGMAYLHSRNILLRDLKPQNIGFDEETGKVTLFDFGFARPLSECRNEEICGTPRYMAPEVMTAEGYTLKSDVYSFGIVLYELCSLRDAFSSKHEVVHDGQDILEKSEEFSCRPALHHVPCEFCRSLIEDCWAQDPNKRPSFEHICNALRKILRIGCLSTDNMKDMSSSSRASISTYKTTETMGTYSFCDP